MPINVTCPQCRMNHTFGNDKAGLRSRCRGCGTIVSIPAGDTAPPQLTSGPVASTSPIRTRSTRGLPKLRPLIYGLVGLLIFGALAFRWWFSPPTVKPVTTDFSELAQKMTQVAVNGLDPSEIVRTPEPDNVASVSVSDKVQQVLNEARSTIIREGTSTQFNSLLQSVVNELPELKISTESGTVMWNRLTLYKDGLLLNAFRFTSPLDVDGDLFWCFATPSEAGSWYILPATGSMTGFDSFQRSTDMTLEGLDLPRTANVVTQQLLGGNIRQGQTYIVYFNAKSPGEMPLRVAARILPTREYFKTDTVPSRVLRKIGVNELPLIKATAGSRVLQGHTDTVIHQTWRPSGEMISFDADGNICTWNIDDARLISKTATGQRIVNAAVSSDGKLAVLLSRKPQRVALFNLETLQMMEELPSHEGLPRFVCFAPDQKSIFVTYGQKTAEKPFREEIVNWSLETHQPIAQRVTDDLQFRGIQATNDGLRVIGSISNDRGSLQAAYFDSPLDLSTTPTIATNTGLINLSSFRVQNNTRELFVDFYGLIKIRRTGVDNEPAYVCSIPNHVDNACRLPDDRYVALACVERVVHLFDTVEQRVCKTWYGHEDSVTRVGTSPDGKTLVSSSNDGSIRLWDLTKAGLADHQEKTIVDSQGHQLRPIPASEFTMGSSPGLLYHRNYMPMREYLRWEQPQHRVRISRPYYMASREVTIAQFRRFVEATNYVTTVEKNGLGGHVIESPQRGFVQKPELTWKNPGYSVTENHPAVQISWEDAQAYCAWLSELENATYRLPTEAEWEFACGADSVMQLSFLFYDSLYVLCCNVADASIRQLMGQNYQTAALWNDGHALAAEVGTYLPNKFGISEMLGNVWELCQDSWLDHYEIPTTGDQVLVDPVRQEGALHVCRGGSFYFNPHDSRACRRDQQKPDEVQADLGFRVLREFPNPDTKN